MPALLLAAPPVLFLLLFFVYPVATILLRGLAPDGQLDVGAAIAVLTRPFVFDVAWFTLWQAVVSTILTVLAALPAAYVFARFEFRGRRLLSAAALVPFVLPTVVVAAAFLALVGPRSPVGLRLEHTIWVILIAHIFYNYAVVLRVVGGVWGQLDPRLEEAARVLGATRWQAFRKVTLPLLRPAIASAASIVFLFTFTSFGVILILGGPRFATLEVEIYRQAAQLLDLRVAATLALLQLAALLALLLIYSRFQERPAVRTRFARARLVLRRPRTRGERAFVLVNIGVMVALLGMPLAVLVERSLSVAGGYGLDYYVALFAETTNGASFVPPLEAIRNSLLFAAITTGFSTVLGLLAAQVIARQRGPLARGIRCPVDAAPRDIRGHPRLRVPGRPGHPARGPARVAADHPHRPHAGGHSVRRPRRRSSYALDRSPFARRGGCPRLVTGADVARNRSAHRRPGGSHRRRVLVRRIARGVRGDAVHRSSGHADDADSHLSTPWPAGRPGFRPGNGDGDRADARRGGGDLCDRSRPSAVGAWALMLRLTGASVRFDSMVALDSVDLEVRNGERLSVLGPSGSGKSTLLRAICGLEPLSAGRIEWDGEDLADVPVHKRGFGLMFQDYVLFPHLDVSGNIRFGLDMTDSGREQANARVAEVLELVGLRGFERRLPAELSGGEQQRVALARALTVQPKLLLLDEPLGALDRSLRRSLLDELSDVFSGLGLPIVYVTHDHEEALAIGDRVAVMHDGRIEAVLPPRELWQHPPTEFVARFLGFTNIVDAEVAGGMAITSLGTFRLDQPTAAEGPHRALIRPDAFRFDDAGPIDALVRSSTFRGSHTLLRVSVSQPNQNETVLDVEADWPSLPNAGDRVRLRVEGSGIVLLPLT